MGRSKKEITYSRPKNSKSEQICREIGECDTMMYEVACIFGDNCVTTYC